MRGFLVGRARRRADCVMKALCAGMGARGDRETVGGCGFDGRADAGRFLGLGRGRLAKGAARKGWRSTGFGLGRLRDGTADYRMMMCVKLTAGNPIDRCRGET